MPTNRRESPGELPPEASIVYTPNEEAEAAAKALAIDAARMLHDDKCEDVVVLDVRRLSQVSDFLVIGSGSSDRQMRSAADDVAKAAAQTGSSVFGRSIDDRTTWIVLDMVDVVVHIFEPNVRAHYDLEMLWGEAERVAWERAGDGSKVAGNRDRAGLGKPERRRGDDGREAEE
ncbi:MAG: ribosome silencing factor [Phycisphaeraceae bacterium]|nr:ribosome silencing factor [Phycisphaeraceae bacterium]